MWNFSNTESTEWPKSTVRSPKEIRIFGSDSGWPRGPELSLGRNASSVRWQPVEISSSTIDQQLGPKALASVSPTEQTTVKSAHSPNKIWKVYNKWYHLCLCLSLAKIISSSGSSNCGAGWGMWQSPWRGGRFQHGAYRVSGLASFVLAQRSANLSPILWNNCVWYDLSSPIKKGSVFRKTKTFLLSVVLSHDWAFFFNNVILLQPL